MRAVATNGRIAVSGSYDCNLRVWDLNNGICLNILVRHTQRGKDIGVLPI